jgi:lipopolysaccharide exporter
MVTAAKAAKNVAWTIATGSGSRAVGMVGTLLLTRFLAPDIAGDISAAHVVCLSFNQFLTVGIGVYLIANPTAPRKVTLHATWIHLFLGFVAFALSIALCRPLSPIFDAPKLVQYVPGLALSLLIDRFTFIPEKLLVRSMRFRRVGVGRGLGEILLAVVAVTTAKLGAGGYCLVYGNLARATLNLVIQTSALPRREWLGAVAFEWPQIKMLMSYGTIYSLASLAAQASRRWDNLVVSRYFGTWVMGAYNLAYNVADVPSIQVGEQIADVLLASMANMQPARRQSALLRASGLLAIVMFPLAVGLGAIGPSLARVFLDPRWQSAGTMLVLLSALALTRPLTNALISYLQVHNRITDITFIEIANLVFMLACLLTFGRINYLWACGAIGISFALRLGLAMIVVRRREGVPMLPILNRQWRPLLACVPMVAAVLALRHLFFAHGYGERMGVRASPMLAAEIAGGAVAYILAALVIAHEASRDLLRLGLELLRRRRGDGDDGGNSDGDAAQPAAGGGDNK